MKMLAITDSGASPAVRPAPSPASPAPLRSAQEPQLPWTPSGDGGFELHAPALDAVLSPLPSGQSMRLLEVNGRFHILTGKVDDDRLMQVRAEDVVAGFGR